MAFWAVTAFVFGIAIGSFLNVVIWRLPRGQSLVYPSSSYCPKCEHSLNAIDLIPLLSFLVQRCRCRYCKALISWRYFTVELLTGALFLALTLRFWQQPPNCIAVLLFAAILVPVYFIDLDTFTIPDSLNLCAFAIGVGRDVFGIVQHEPDHALLWGWCPRSIFGAAVSVLALGAVRILGWIWKRQEAMGLGDVLLVRGMGALLVSFAPEGANPLRHFLVWFLLACFSGAVVGPMMIWWRSRKAVSLPNAEGADEPEYPETHSNLGEQFYAIGYCLWLGDLWDYVRDVVQRLGGKKPAPPVLEEDFEMAPTAIPFGPFIVLGFLLTLFAGEWIVMAYLNYAFPNRINPS